MRTVRTTPTVTVPRVKLGSIVLETQYGTSQKANEDGQGIPILRMGNITNTGHLDLRDLKHVVLPDGEVDKYSVRKGDLLFNRTNSPDLVGKMAIWDRPENFAIAGYLVRVRLHREIADPRFVSYWFNTLEMKAELRAHAKPSINMSNISASELLKFDVPLLPLPEQRRIADVLDRAEALRAKRRAALAELDGLAQSIFIEMFGDPCINAKQWPVHALEKLLESVTYGTSQRSSLDGLLPVLRMNNLTYTGEMDFSDLKYINLSEHDMARYTVTDGDILFNRTNSAELVGKTAVFCHPKSMAYAGYLIRLRVNPQNEPDYVSSLLNSRWGKSCLRTMAKSIIGMANISASQIRSLMVPSPPLDLQQEFARRVAAVERLKAVQRASLAELDALFASLQDRAFRGAL
jgi:type I restriction enzyme S subunit